MFRINCKLDGRDFIYMLAPQCKSAVISKKSSGVQECLVSGGALTCIMVAIEAENHFALSHLDSISDFNYFFPHIVSRIRIFFNLKHTASEDLAKKFQLYVKDIPNVDIKVDIVPLERDIIGSALFLNDDFYLEKLDDLVEKIPRENMIIYSKGVSLLKGLFAHNFPIFKGNLCPSLDDVQFIHQKVVSMCLWVVKCQKDQLRSLKNPVLEMFNEGDEKHFSINFRPDVQEALREYLKFHEEIYAELCAKYKIDYVRAEESFNSFRLFVGDRFNSDDVGSAVRELHRYDEQRSRRQNIFE